VQVDAVAYLGEDAGRLFLQPEHGAETLLCNGHRLEASRWLAAGDRIVVGDAEIAVEDEGGAMRLRVAPRTAPATAPPRIVGDGAERSTQGEAIVAEAFEARAIKPRRRRGLRFRAIPLAAWAVVIALGAAAWYLFSSVPIAIRVAPSPDVVEIDTLLPVPVWGDRHLLRPGRYTLRALKQGYEPLEATFEVSRGGPGEFDFSLQKSGGRLTLDIRPGDATVEIDGEQIAPWQEPIPLSPGEHHLVVHAERHRSFEATFTIAGEGQTETRSIELEPAWADLQIASRPPGAEIRIDGEAVGSTPATLEVLEGVHSMSLHKRAFKPHRARLEVRAGEHAELPVIQLTPADGKARITSEPPGASILVGGELRGQTPLELELAPGRDHRITASLAGFTTHAEDVRVSAEEGADLHLELRAERGDIRLVVEPAEAMLWIDGEPHGRATGELRLVARPTVIEIRADGHEPYRTTLLPTPGLEQLLEVRLVSDEEARSMRTPAVASTPTGHELVLVTGGRFTAGASRREPGRRANETQFEVELKRPFYISVYEVTNEQFRSFRESHLSGGAAGANLEREDAPVVRVTWEDAVEYCNWLSEQAGLPAAYERRAGRWVGASPMNTGFRLPTEAEWARVARFPEGGVGQRYPWGSALPVAKGAGNIADRSAAALIRSALDAYEDGFAATAPVGSFEPNALGIHDLAGNVAEWTHDIYSVRPVAPGAVATDPSGPSDGELHVIRGSSWMDYSVSELRSSYRDYGKEMRPDLGFRIARYAE
jgi:formylglycine-generating enzyme required for sulfatase activity